MTIELQAAFFQNKTFKMWLKAVTVIMDNKADGSSKWWVLSNNIAFQFGPSLFPISHDDDQSESREQSAKYIKKNVLGADYKNNNYRAPSSKS